MHKLELTLACGRYDRTQALIDGRVQPEGVNLTFIPLRPGETFWRMLNHGEFDVSEMSLSSYTILRSEGDTRFTAIPVFPSRTFRHSAIYLRADSRIERPEGIRLESIPADTTLEEMLERGEIDALVSVMIPKAIGKTVRRLFGDFRKVESEYYKKTGIFPIMHTLVLKTALYEQKPWLAVSFYRAFCRARDLAYQHLYDTDALTVSLPWIIDDVESTRGIFGPQIWDYSIEGSRPTLDALVAYLDEQKLSRRRMKVEELFVPNISPGLTDYLRATGED